MKLRSDGHDINRLREMTQKVTLTKIIDGDKGNIMNYECVNGECRAHGIMNIPKISVCYAYMKRDSQIKEHSHYEVEYLLVYHGCMNIYFNKKLVGIIKEGECIKIPANTPHHVTTDVDVWLLGVTIPAAEGYPTGVA